MRKTLRTLRQNKGLSYEKKKKKLGMSKSTYYKIEFNLHDGSFETWMKIKMFFKLKDNEILDIYHENKKVAKRKGASNGK